MKLTHWIKPSIIQGPKSCPKSWIWS